LNSASTGPATDAAAVDRGRIGEVEFDEPASGDSATGRRTSRPTTRRRVPELSVRPAAPIPDAHPVTTTRRPS
jgi:hypothetical protein